MFLVACGYRTPPEPYEAMTGDLPGITETSLNFRGDNLVFRWHLKDYSVFGPQGEQGLMATSGMDRSAEIPDATGDTEPDTVNAETIEMQDDVTDQTDEEPTTVIQHFRLNLLQEALGCNDCSPVLLARIILPAFGGKPSVETTDARIWRQEETTMSAAHGLNWNPIEGFVFTLPAGLFNEGVLEERRYFTVDYVMEDERMALPSYRLYPRRPHPVPPPEISVRKLISVRQSPLSPDPGHLVWSDFQTFIGIPGAEGIGTRMSETSVVSDDSDRTRRLPLPLNLDRTQTGKTVFIEEPVYDPQAKACRAPTVSFFLLLEWPRRHETVVHVTMADGRFYESVRHYGVNLYRVRQSDANGDSLSAQSPVGWEGEERINPLPLQNGSFSLSNFHDDLYARHVDRYGNESVSVLVFDGRYE
jgi:hypothetical protein